MTPLVPTMGQNAEYFFNPTPTSAMPTPKDGTFLRFKGAPVPAMQVALRHSTHLEWTYVPYILPASHDGERVAMYYTLAWFDQWLKGGARDAAGRLTATVFDGSADASAIGAGAYDATTSTNQPYLLAGQPVADHLSVYYVSEYAFDGNTCTDMRHGCPS